MNIFLIFLLGVCFGMEDYFYQDNGTIVFDFSQINDNDTHNFLIEGDNFDDFHFTIEAINETFPDCMVRVFSGDLLFAVEKYYPVSTFTLFMNEERPSSELGKLSKENPFLIYEGHIKDNNITIRAFENEERIIHEVFVRDFFVDNFKNKKIFHGNFNTNISSECLIMVKFFTNSPNGLAIVSNDFGMSEIKKDEEEAIKNQPTASWKDAHVYGLLAILFALLSGSCLGGSIIFSLVRSCCSAKAGKDAKNAKTEKNKSSKPKSSKKTEKKEKTKKTVKSKKDDKKSTDVKKNDEKKSQKIAEKNKDAKAKTSKEKTKKSKKQKSEVSANSGFETVEKCA